jgi:hypothetical protein
MATLLGNSLVRTFLGATMVLVLVTLGCSSDDESGAAGDAGTGDAPRSGRPA